MREDDRLQLRRPIFERIIRECGAFDPIPVAVVCPLSVVALSGAIDAANAALAIPYLVGPRAQIASLAREMHIDFVRYPIVDVADDLEAARRAVDLCRAGTCQALMQGNIQADQLLKAVLWRTSGLRLNRRLSHALVVDSPQYPRPFILTDSVVNLYPKLEDKADIVQNAINLAHWVGIPNPRVAILSVVARVSSKISSTIDASALCKMAERGQITGGILDGPLAFDDAMQPETARIKQIHSPVAGQADVLVTPDVEAGTLVAKHIQSQADADTAGVVLGARVPIVLSGRISSAKNRIASMAVAVLLAHQQNDADSQPAFGFAALLQSEAWLSEPASEAQ